MLLILILILRSQACLFESGISLWAVVFVCYLNALTDMTPLGGGKTPLFELMADGSGWLSERLFVAALPR